MRAAYAPTDVCKFDVKEVFYGKLASVVPSKIFGLFCEISMQYPAVIELATRCLLVPIAQELITAMGIAFSSRASISLFQTPTQIVGHGIIILVLWPRRSATRSW